MKIVRTPTCTASSAAVVPMNSGTVESSIIASSMLVGEDPSVMIGSLDVLLGVGTSDRSTSSVDGIPSVGIESLVMGSAEIGLEVSGSSAVF